MRKINKILVSIVIPILNGGEIYKKVIRKVLQQDLPHAFEIIIIDSGSKDGSLEYTLALQRKHSNILVEQISKSEFGHGKTRNLGVSLSRGQFVAFLTQDALPVNNLWLKNIILPMQKDPKCAGVFGKHLPYDDADIFEKDSLFHHFNGFGKKITYYEIEDRYRYKVDPGYLHHLCFYSDNSSCLRKSIWKKIPYRDIEFGEDQMFAKDILEAGYKKAYSPDSIVYHSHNYNFKDMIKRCQSEFKFLKEIFDYESIPHFEIIPVMIFRHCKSDLKFLIKNKLGYFKTIYWSFYSIKKNTARYLGAYKGQQVANKDKLRSNKSSPVINKNKAAKFLFYKICKSFKRNGIKTTIRLIKYRLAQGRQSSLSLDGLEIINVNKFLFLPKRDSQVKSRPKTRRLAWLMPDFGIGSGGHLNIFRMIKNLEKHDFISDIYIIEGSQWGTEKKSKEIISEHFFKFTGNVYFFYQNQEKKFEQKYTLAFATSWNTVYYLNYFNCAFRKAYFVQDFEPYFFPYGSNYQFALKTYTMGYPGITAGTWLAKKLKKEFDMPCYPFNFGFDRKAYIEVLPKKDKVERVFFYARPPTDRRGFELGVLALYHLYKKRPNIEVVFAGWDLSGYRFPFINLNAGVLKLEELPQLYANCSVALVISFTNLSLLPLEIIASGCPVVINEGENNSWLDKSKYFHYSKGDPESLGNKLDDVLSLPKDKRLNIEKSKSFLNQLSWEKETEKVASYIETIVSK